VGKNVLVVDDEEYMRLLLSRALSRAGFFVTTVADPTEALTLLTNGADVPVPFDVLLTDFNLPSITGLDLVDALRCDGVELPCLLMSVSPNEMLAFEALSRGCKGFIKKPFGLPVLVECIYEALEVRTEQGAARS
jgi:DNA-binding NtrC family response regulator